MDILTYINTMNRLYGSEPLAASLPPTSYEEIPMPNIQDLIREEGIQVGQQVKDGGRIYDTRKYFKPGGLVEPGVTHYAKTNEEIAAEKKNIRTWEKTFNKKIEDQVLHNNIG